MTAALLVLLSQQPSEWVVHAERRKINTNAEVTFTGREAGLPDGTILECSLYFPNERRYSNGDGTAPYREKASIMVGDALPVTYRTEMKGGAWTQKFALDAQVLAPGVLELVVEFEPQRIRQPAAVRSALGTKAKPFRRAATFLLIDPVRETGYLAADMERVSKYVQAFKAEISPLARPDQALPAGTSTRVPDEYLKGLPEIDPAADPKLITPTRTRRAVMLMEKVVMGSIPGRDPSPFYQTLFQLNIGLNEATTLNNPSDPAAYHRLWVGMFGRVAQKVEDAHVAYNVEAYVHMRTLMSEVRDRTWLSYQAAGKDPNRWGPWRRTADGYVVALRAAHQKLTELEMAELYRKLAKFEPPKPPEEPPKEPVPPPKPEDPPKEDVERQVIPLDRLENLIKACDARLKDPKAALPDPILELLALDLPGPPRGLLPEEMEKRLTEKHGAGWFGSRRASGMNVPAPIDGEEGTPK